MQDKFKALWLSHSSISDFLNCPRSYYLRHVYKNPKSGHKITEIKPPLAMGQVIHDVLTEVSFLPVRERLTVPLKNRLMVIWPKIAGKKGGFKDKEEEMAYQKRAEAMLEKVETNPGPIISKAIKLKTEDGLPYFWLSAEEGFILSGKIDWIEYLPDDTIHIIDFKTGKNEEGEESLQLPIYFLLASNLQKRKIAKMSYWYLDSSDTPVEMPIPSPDNSLLRIMEVGRRIKLGRQINHLKCPKDGCFFCKPLEKILAGEGELVGVSEYNQDIYYLP